MDIRIGCGFRNSTWYNIEFKSHFILDVASDHVLPRHCMGVIPKVSCGIIHWIRWSKLQTLSFQQTIPSSFLRVSDINMVEEKLGHRGVQVSVYQRQIKLNEHITTVISSPTKLGLRLIVFVTCNSREREWKLYCHGSGERKWSWTRS